MEELYPGYISGAGFRAEGLAVTLPKDSQRKPGSIAIQFSGFGDHGLHITNLAIWGDRTSAECPNFTFPDLTARFLSNAIQNDRSFEFSAVRSRLGRVTYVTGAAAREYHGEVSQHLISLRARGALDEKGLTLAMEGELGEQGFLDAPTADQFRQHSYMIDACVPWSALRFLFWDQLNWVLSNYSRIHSG